ncbi:MAG: hypothetical protein JHC33_12545 [Ignisphaera sp.]|nr:hypothetical protein [Ignisphaera sp.]
MSQLTSNLTPSSLFTLIKDVVEGTASSYTFLPVEVTGEAHVSTHEVIFDSDGEIATFTLGAQEYLTTLFGKKVPKGRGGSSDPAYSIFASLFTSQSGIVRILWLHGKILSVLVGSKPFTIVGEKKNDPIIYSAYNFGFSPDSKAGLSLSQEDKDLLMALPMASWPTMKQKPGMNPNNPDANKSLSVAYGYLRHGSVEKVVDKPDLFYLAYPKSTSNFFTSGGSWGSGLPSLVANMSKFEYGDLLDTQSLTTGEWNRYREYDNNVFMASKDISANLSQRTFFRFSFNSIEEFEKSKKAVAGKNAKDLITRKYSVFTQEDTKKYFDNPRYDIVFSPDQSMFYVCRSDKLKATALQTRITKSLREDFIRFINWIGYYQLCADLDPANMANSFVTVKLMDAKLANWAEPCQMTLKTLKNSIVKSASAKYKELYMSESSGVVNVLSNLEIFNSVFKQHNASQDRYSDIKEFDPYRMLNPISTNDNNLLSFNKKFSLNISLIALMQAFSRGTNVNTFADYSRIYYSSVPNVMSFLTTNFLVSDKIEKKIEGVLSSNADNNNGRGMQSVNYWHFNYIDELKEDQLFRTCMTLSPEAVAIFNSVATLTTPTDIMSWLELAREHFTVVLPQQLVDKYGDKVAPASRISAILNAGIEYYSLILSAAEPFSNKMLNTDETGD